MKIITLIILITAPFSVTGQIVNQKITEPADLTLLKTNGRIITLMDKYDFCVFTDYD